MYNDTELASIERLKKDVRQAVATLSDTEAPFLVDAYYHLILGEDVRAWLS